MEKQSRPKFNLFGKIKNGFKQLFHKKEPVIKPKEHLQTAIPAPKPRVRKLLSKPKANCCIFLYNDDTRARMGRKFGEYLQHNRAGYVIKVFQG